jgi:hypothetical protein
MEENWQNIAVGIILVAVVVWLVRTVFKAIVARKYAKCNTCDDATCPFSKKQ